MMFFLNILILFLFSSFCCALTGFGYDFVRDEPWWNQLKDPIKIIFFASSPILLPIGLTGLAFLEVVVFICHFFKGIGILLKALFKRDITILFKDKK